MAGFETFEQELFELSEDDRMLLNGLRQSFLIPHLKPLADEILYSNEFSEDIYQRAIKAAAEAEVCGFNIPEEYGGLGLSGKMAARFIEEMSAVDGGIGLSIGASSSLIANPIILFGTEDQKKLWLPRIARGDIIGCYCQTESDAGSDVSSIKTRARKDEHGRWIINGEKQFITNGAQAHLALVIARSNINTDNPRQGLTVFLVDLERAKAAGQFQVLRTAERKAGLHASPTSAVAFADCEADDILGDIDGGWKVLMTTLASSRITAIGPQGVGIAKGAWRIADAYARERMQFGDAIVQFPDIQWELFSMESAISAAHLIVLRSVALRERFSQINPQDSRPWQMEASVTKLYASELAHVVSSRAMQILGGFGYMMESRVPKFWQDGRVVPIYEGTSGIQRLVIGREMIIRALTNANFDSWDFSKDWVFSNPDEESVFIERMDQTSRRNKLLYYNLLQLRGKFVRCFQRSLQASPPSPDASALPLVWRFVADAFCELEAAKLVLWKAAYCQDKGHSNAKRFSAHAMWALHQAKIRVNEFAEATDRLHDLQEACSMIAEESFNEEDF